LKIYLTNIPQNWLNASPRFSMEHLLQGLNGVDAPAWGQL